MENKMASLLAFNLMIIAIVVNVSPANGDITCQAALLDLMPCQLFLASSGPPTPSIACCGGVQTVYTQASTTAIRRTLCECLKKAAAGLQVDPSKLQQIPQFCKVSLPFALDPSIDCSKVPLI